ncbi:hypothetical protein NUITMVRA1_19460 [Aerococcus viridans]|uniref:hypothetical protein n=1 Tax=Aerococcus viridans TaxID=1377 RepID=UPI0028FDAF54|nr:hypothetical protein NUITMVRA1_19460 [Aerococcus viridans]
MKKNNLFILNLIGVIGYILLSYFFHNTLITNIYLFILILSFYYVIEKIHRMNNSAFNWARGIIALFSVLLLRNIFSQYPYSLMTNIIFFVVILSTIGYITFFTDKNKEA